jgi:hypothetical protein
MGRFGDRNGDKVHDENHRRSELTGTVYKILGFGFPLGQPSKIARRELEDIPSASVSTSVRVIIIKNFGGRIQGPSPTCSQCKLWNMGITPL